MADLGSLIMSSSLFSRFAILFSAPSDMADLKQSFSGMNKKVSPLNCVEFTWEPLFCSWLTAGGLEEQPLGSQPTQIAPNNWNTGQKM